MGAFLLASNAFRKLLQHIPSLQLLSARKSVAKSYNVLLLSVDFRWWGSISPHGNLLTHSVHKSAATSFMLVQMSSQLKQRHTAPPARKKIFKNKSDFELHSRRCSTHRNALPSTLLSSRDDYVLVLGDFSFIAAFDLY